MEHRGTLNTGSIARQPLEAILHISDSPLFENAGTCWCSLNNNKNQVHVEHPSPAYLSVNS